MTAHAQEYVRGLYEDVTAADPIRTAHAVFGRTLHRIAGTVAARRLDSVNVRGPETENQQWQTLASVAQPGDDQAAAGTASATSAVRTE
jgi:hypothetical protein